MKFILLGLLTLGNLSSYANEMRLQEVFKIISIEPYTYQNEFYKIASGVDSVGKSIKIRCRNNYKAFFRRGESRWSEAFDKRIECEKLVKDVSALTPIEITIELPVNNLELGKVVMIKKY